MGQTWMAGLLTGVFVAGSGPMASQRDQTDTPQLKIAYEAGRVVRRDAARKIIWSRRIDGYLGLVRPPHLLWDSRRVYVSRNDGVTALAADTGRVLWHSKGPNHRMLLSGGLLLAADCSTEGERVSRGRWLL